MRFRTIEATGVGGTGLGRPHASTDYRQDRRCAPTKASTREREAGLLQLADPLQAAIKGRDERCGGHDLDAILGLPRVTAAVDHDAPFDASDRGDCL